MTYASKAVVKGVNAKKLRSSSTVRIRMGDRDRTFSLAPLGPGNLLAKTSRQENMTGDLVMKRGSNKLMFMPHKKWFKHR
jgi:hypothetical protein